MSHHQITEHIFLGSLMSLRAAEEFKAANVTHVLSLLSPPADPSRDQRWMSMPVFGNIDKHLHIEIDDVEDSDIMKYFGETNAFIDDAVSKGESVLVHCAAGISRSVTCVCAYVMKTLKLDASEAIDYVRSKRPVANPNAGYCEQLDAYYKDGYVVDESSKNYREWKLKQSGNADTIYTQLTPQKPALSWEQVFPQLNPDLAPVPKRFRINGELVAKTERAHVPPTDPVQFDADGTQFWVDQTRLRSLLNQTVQRRIGVFRCKSCATKVATANSVLTHEVGSHAACQNFFIEPVEWMRAELERGDLEGKLGCPKCRQKLGSYQWQGSRCTCGTWVTPAIKLSKSKVDGMGLPPLL